jgi:hypothetical protein
LASPVTLPTVSLDGTFYLMSGAHNAIFVHGRFSEVVQNQHPVRPKSS